MRSVRTSGTVGAALLALTAALPACSVKKMAVNSLGKALAEGASAYASDDDPDLVRDASPFALKTIESLLEASPRNEDLLLAAAKGFTQYSYGFLQQEADFIEETDLAKATALRDRARKLYRRALGYGLRGLDVDFPGFHERLRADPSEAVARTRKEHVPLLFWTANAWGAAIALSKSDSELTADQNLAEALMRRALALDEGFQLGSSHDFFITYEGSRASVGGSVSEARLHLERALALSKGQRAAPIVGFAEAVCVGAQDSTEFTRLLEQALAIEPGQAPDYRLSNLIYQKRARWLLSRREALFIE
jgi:predicted anti-sigma-YlaC factor YlaD